MSFEISSLWPRTHQSISADSCGAQRASCLLLFRTGLHACATTPAFWVKLKLSCWLSECPTDGPAPQPTCTPAHTCAQLHSKGSQINRGPKYQMGNSGGLNCMPFRGLLLLSICLLSLPFHSHIPFLSRTRSLPASDTSLLFPACDTNGPLTDTSACLRNHITSSVTTAGLSVAVSVTRWVRVLVNMQPLFLPNRRHSKCFCQVKLSRFITDKHISLQYG